MNANGPTPLCGAEGGQHRTLADDLLIGAKAIAGFTGLRERQVFYLHQKGALPTFNLGGLIAGRKSELCKRLSGGA